MNGHEETVSNTDHSRFGLRPFDGAKDGHRGFGATKVGSQLALPLSRQQGAIRAKEQGEVKTQDEIRAGDPRAAATDTTGDEATPLGRHLAAARENRGWSRADVAARLKLPVKLIDRLENGDYAGLTEGIFLRGYLTSYARLVGVPTNEAMHVASLHSHAAPLIATGTISRSRFLFDRYSVSATYLILTAIIVVPAVWLATHGGLQQNLARTTPLDVQSGVTTASPVNVTPTTPISTTASASIESSGTKQALPFAGESLADPPPVIASMTPFPSEHASSAPAIGDTATPETQPLPSTAAHTLELKLAQQSWVEITGADGKKLEYGMLAAGTEHNYQSNQPVSVLLGNAQGAEVTTDGTVLDLAPFERGNVAHLKLFDTDRTGDTRTDHE